MKRLLICLLLILNIACASSIEVRMVKKYDTIESEFVPYVYEFIHASKGKVQKRHFKNFTMGFRDYNEDDNTIGTCHYLANEVDISRDWWNNTASPSQRLELAFHELGHCILKRGHTKKPTHSSFEAWLERVLFNLGIFDEKEYLQDGCPASFMHPYNLGDHCINKHFNYYINELFGRYEKHNYVESRSWHEPASHNNKCREPKIINKTNTWNKRDEDTLARAKVRCLDYYNSCLKTFWKNSSDSYTALCE